MHKIMVVDDEAIIVMGLEKLLKSMGYEVVGLASSGEKAIEMAKRLKPDLILMDIVIPGDLDGIDASEIITTELDIPVVFLTAHAGDELIQRAKKAGPFGYIMKPFDENEIKANIEIAIHKKEMERIAKRTERKGIGDLEDSALKNEVSVDGFYDMPLSERILVQMKKLGLTQERLSRRSGLTQQSISNYINNKSKPGYNAIAALAKALGVNPAWFFDRDELRYPIPSTRSRGRSNKRTGGDVIVFGKPQQGVKFVIGHYLPMQHIPSPLQVYSGITGDFYQLIFNRLARWPAGVLRGSLAVDWKQIDSHWIFQLRQGVRFHNGGLLTAGDVRWSYERYLELNPDEPLIQSVEVIDDTFFQINLKAPCRLEDVPMPFILPYGTTEMPSLIGTGPFQVSELKPGYWRLESNPRYFLSKPYFGEVHIREYPNPDALENALKEGEVHFAIGVYYPGEKFIAKTEPVGLRYQLHFVLTEPLVQNVNLRQAISIGLDRTALARAADLKQPIYSSGPFDYILNDRMDEPPAPDVEGAKQLLSRVPELKDSTFRIKYFRSDPRRHNIVCEIVKQLRRLGISAEIGEPAHALIATRPTYVLNLEYRLWISSDRFNISGYSNPKVDELIKKYKNTAANPSQLRNLRQLILMDIPEIYLFYDEYPLTYVNELRALENRMILLVCLSEIHNWYLEDTQREKKAETSLPLVG